MLVKEAMANGRLVASPPAPLVDIAERHGVGADAIAIAAVLGQPWADTVLCGPAGIGQLSSNLRALAVRLTEQDSDRLGGLAESAVDYWSERAALAWR